MSNATRTLIAFFAVFILLVGGCKKSAEGESAAWTANVAQVNELSAQYPGFKPALQARLSDAQTMWGAAEGLADAAKVEQMAAANAALMKGFVGDLKGLPKKMDGLRKKRVEAAAKAGDESSRLAAKVAAEDAQKALDRAQATLEKGAADEASAAAVLAKVEADLKTATEAVDEVLKVDKEKTEDKVAKEDAKADADAKAKAEADAEVAAWKCEFCGSRNTHDKTKCDSCGAPRGDTKE